MMIGHKNKLKGAISFILAASFCLFALTIIPALPSTLSFALQAQDKESEAKKQLDKLNSEIEKREASKKALENKAKAAGSERESLQQQMVKLGSKLQRTERTVFRLDDRIEKLEGLSLEKRTALLSNKDSMVELMAALQRMGRRPAAASLLQPRQALDTARSAALLATLLPHIDSKANKLHRDLTYLSSLYKELSDKRFSLKNQLTELALQNTVLKNLVARREIEESESRAAARGESLRIARLVRSSKNTKDLLKQLEIESAKFRARQEKIARAAAARIRLTVKKPPPTATKKSNPTTQPKSAPFLSLRGNMPYPTMGKVIKRYGQQDGVGKAKGIRLSVRAGTQVISPFEGRVVYAGPFRDYGQLIIIAHKDGYHGLLSGIGSLYTAINQWVLQGEPVGMVGGAQGRISQLYFELRSDTGPFNPLPWLKR